MKTYSTNLNNCLGSNFVTVKIHINYRCIFFCFAHFKSQVSRYTCILADAVIGHQPFQINIYHFDEDKTLTR